MNRPTTPAEWEQLLRSEGMPTEFATTRRQALTAVRDDTVEGAGLSSSSTYQHWTRMTHAANALPRNWKGRQFVIAYAETGYFHATCETHGLTRREGEAVLVRFAKYTKEHDDTAAD